MKTSPQNALPTFLSDEELKVQKIPSTGFKTVHSFDLGEGKLAKKITVRCKVTKNGVVCKVVKSGK
jgi:hypothetical protein